MIRKEDIRRGLYLILLPTLLISFTMSSPEKSSWSNGILADYSSSSSCEEITLPMCATGIGYNFTHMPNQFGHDSQEEAGMEVHQYYALVKLNCSPDLRVLLCSLYLPSCLKDVAGAVPPCRSVCERARHGCEPIMLSFGFEWPSKMNCDRFPEFESTNRCIGEQRRKLSPPLIRTVVVAESSMTSNVLESSEVSTTVGPTEQKETSKFLLILVRLYQGLKIFFQATLLE